ncbi:hypothetical protein PMIN03_012539 [Paraphaeosphaeria minitans]
MNAKKRFDPVPDVSSLGKLSSWDWMNGVPGMTEQKASDAQLQLYEGYGDPFYYWSHGVAALIRAPENVQQGSWTEPTPVVISYHGGGGTCGRPDYPPNYKTHIAPIFARRPFIIEPFTKLIPEHSGREAHADQDKLYQNILTSRLEKEMKKHWPNLRVPPQWENILVIGVSSGGHWATYAWAQQSKKMGITCMYIMYGMLRSYSRHSDDEYRGIRFHEDQLRTTSLELLHETAKRRPWSSPMRGRFPPEGMANLPLTAVRTLVSRNGGPPGYETLWFLCWQYPSVLDWSKQWLEEWFKETLEGRIDLTERQARWKDVLEGHLRHDELTKLELWARDVFEGRIKLAEGSRAMDVSRTVILDARKIEEKLGETLRNLGLEYVPEMNALSCTVPEARLPRPLHTSRWFLVHDKNDPFVPQGDTDIFSNILRIMYGDEAVHYRIVEGSNPPHGFDDYDGSRSDMAQILKETRWRPRDTKLESVPVAPYLQAATSTH